MLVINLLKTCRASCARLLLAIFGWKVRGSLPKHDKLVVIAAPHTSAWDYPLMMLASWCFNREIFWIGKQELFSNWLMRKFFLWTGGIPVDRSKKENRVAKIANLIGEKTKICLLISPEGSRSRKNGWHTGFYYIALQAKVHVACGFIDFADKTLGVGPSIMPSGDIEPDMQKLENFYKDKRGKFPRQESPIKVLVK